MNSFKRCVAFVLCVSVLNLGSPLVARAQIIGTLQAVESHNRAADLAVVSSALERDQVRAQFVALGVDPAGIDARVAALTDAELHTLAGQMQDMPAGSDFLAIVGIVFLVLLILEAVGVTDIFKKFP